MTRYLKKVTIETHLILTCLLNYASQSVIDDRSIPFLGHRYRLINVYRSMCVFKCHKDLIIAISGSKDFHDYLTCEQRAVNNVYVDGLGVIHGGVHSEASKYYHQVRKYVRDYSDHRIIFTGHSLGGAVSHYLYWMTKTEFYYRKDSFYHVGYAPLRYIVLESDLDHCIEGPKDSRSSSYTFEGDLVQLIDTEVFFWISALITMFSNTVFSHDLTKIALEKNMKIPGDNVINEDEREKYYSTRIKFDEPLALETRQRRQRYEQKKTPLSLSMPPRAIRILRDNPSPLDAYLSYFKSIEIHRIDYYHLFFIGLFLYLEKS